MSRRLVVMGALCCGLALPATAGAQDGNGPYAPSPSVSDISPADDWYAIVNAGVPVAGLRTGAFTGPLRPVASEGAASTRAGVDVPGAGFGAALAAFVLVLLSGAATVAITTLRRHEKGSTGS